MVVIQFQSCKSESIVVNKESRSILYSELTLFCEVAQLQKFSKSVKVLLAFFEKRLKKSSWVIRKTFSYENLLNVMIKYNDVINNNIKLIEKFNVKLYAILSDPCFLFIVYSSLRKDVVDKFNGVGNVNVIFSVLMHLSKELKSEKYKFVLFQKVHIDKFQGGKKFLEILNIKNVIVQKGLLMLIQPMFKHGFYELLYNFRPNYTCHNVLNAIRRYGNKTIWFIELNLIDVFEKVHYEVLLKEIRSYIGERQIFDLIYKILKVGSIDLFELTNGKFCKKELLFQSSILRPFFVNVFFERLDKWVENNFFFRYNSVKEDYLNLKYLKIVDKYINTESNEVFIFMKERVSSFKFKKIRKAFCEVKKNQTVKHKIMYYATEYNSKKLWYVRYSTHMLLGLVGPKQDAVTIFEGIKVDIEEKLSMKIQLKKAGVSHYSDGVMFLGY